MTMDLFSSDSADCHPLYERLCESDPVSEVRRQHVSALWRWYLAAGLADDNFIAEFPKNTTQRWWELETAWFLSNCGYSLSKRRAGSDFLCKGPDVTFEVEAIAPKPGKEDKPDFVRPISATTNLRERERIELLRLTSAIYNKARKRLGDIEKGSSDPSLPFLIALSPFDLPTMFSGWDMPAALKAVYPIGGQFYRIDPSTGQFLSKQWECRPALSKGSLHDEPISTQVFCPGCGTVAHRKVSGLLYSALDMWVYGYPYNPLEHQGEFIVIHNGDCDVPLRRGSVRAGTEYWLESTGDPGKYELKNEKLILPSEQR